MARVSIELLRKEYYHWQDLKQKEPFGRVMNSKYHFEDKELEKKRIKSERKESKRQREENLQESTNQERQQSIQNYQEGGSSASNKRKSEEEVKEEKMDLEIKEEEMDIDPIEIARVEVLVEEWALEIQNFVKEEPEENPEMNEAWDDVNGGELPLEDVTAARKEEIEYMQGRGIWKLSPLTEC